MKVGIVGSGFVGSTAAYAMVTGSVGREIVLVDRNRARAEAEANDIMHAVPFAHPLEVRQGAYAELAGCRAVILSAGVGQEPGESRLELLGRNAAVFGEVVPRVLEHAPGAVLVVATNPVDIMTHLASRFAADAGVPSSRVIGSGTMLDTARFRTLLGRHFGVDAQHVHAYVLGEHGDSQVLSWSAATIGGIGLDEFAGHREIGLDAAARGAIDRRVRRAASDIIAGKGATYYGIGCALARIVEVILDDQRAILTVCAKTSDVLGVTGVTISLPHLVGGDGILASFLPAMNDAERDLLRASASVVRTAIDSMSASSGCPSGRGRPHASSASRLA